MVQYLQLRSGNSGPPFVGENDGDTVLWDNTLQRWYVGAGGGGGAVDSVFGRAGVVVAATGDYDGDQVDNVSSVPGASVSDALEFLLANAGAVDSVFGRTGAVVAAAGDYDSDQVDNVSGVSGSSVSDALDALQAVSVPAAAVGAVLFNVAGPAGNWAGLGPTTTKTQADADTTITSQSVLLSNHSLTTTRDLEIDAASFEPGTMVHVIFLVDSGVANTFGWVTANITEDAQAPFAGSIWEDFDQSMAIDFRIEFDGANNVARFVGGQLLAQDYSVAFA